MSKRPAFQFYPSDWRTDAALRLCSVGARGLWIEMMCLMHEGVPYGHLTTQGRQIGPDALARLVGESASSVKRWLKELGENEVYSVAEDGSLYSRRMVRDEQIREARATGGEAGKKYGKLGAAHGAKGGRPRKEKPPLPDDQRGVSEPPPSTSSSSPSPLREGSDAYASGDEQSPQPDPPVPIDPEKLMFDGGIALLTGSGKSEGQARTMLGRWKRDHGSEAVIVAIGTAKREGAIEPISFIERCLRNGGHNARPRNDGYRDPILGDVFDELRSRMG